MSPTLPNFVYIGPSKAGSTWLHEVLITQPQVFMTRAKDLYFFDRYFDKAQIHVGLFDDLVESPQQFLDDTVDWLGVDRLPLEAHQRAARLRASRARSKRPAAVVKHGANWARRHRSVALIGRVKRSAWVQNVLYKPLRDRPVPAHEDVDYIRARVLPEIEQLEAMVGMDLRARWGWPR